MHILIYTYIQFNNTLQVNGGIATNFKQLHSDKKRLAYAEAIVKLLPTMECMKELSKFPFIPCHIKAGDRLALIVCWL
ncbi:hypothetical protein [Saccharococcus caldoxylosilyticus]|uniref:Uncharacterized protein n=1 Tax=Parageobacillus caldoxylosilyticus NBRC 107762 TaxID=1220594 RepID=A0A023DJN1_9BACL|nr:hypothetical protein [Parageobacillus caldoxylosilyticus]MBB3854391.1 hypothetical protein [Parageobacillus caldoxylosilyticus]GAJ41469.1 hypothetical protein GCA01S_071_00080 [Parageobacillus caldoxylosilyticus NBRC 107762]